MPPKPMPRYRLKSPTKITMGVQGSGWQDYYTKQEI